MGNVVHTAPSQAFPLGFPCQSPRKSADPAPEVTWAKRCPEHAWVLGVGGPEGAEVKKGLAGWVGEIFQRDPPRVRRPPKGRARMRSGLATVP